MEQMAEGVWLIILLIQSIYDIKWKKIPIGITLLGAVIGMVYSYLAQREWVDIVWALIPGICCMVYAKVSNEALGYGDVWLLCVMGFYLELEQVLLVCMLAFGLAGITGLVLLVFFHKKRKDEIPFVPFILLACLMHMLVQLGENYG